LDTFGKPSTRRRRRRRRVAPRWFRLYYARVIEY
jgi:hypothetical protein